MGGALGVVVALVLPVLIARLEPARVRRERLELIRSAPLVADLLAAALMAGVPLEHAIPVVARAIGGPAGESLMGVHRRTELGEPMARAWAGLSQAPGLGGVARAVARSSRTGAPLAALLAQSAEDLRTQASAAALAEVRATARARRPAPGAVPAAGVRPARDRPHRGRPAALAVIADRLSTDRPEWGSRITATRDRVGPATQGGWLRGTGGTGVLQMNELVVRMRDEDKGMTTAEYAVGTVAVCGLGGVLIKLLSSEKFADLLWQVISTAFSFLF